MTLKTLRCYKEKMPPSSQQPGASEKLLRETTGKISNRACVYLGNCPPVQEPEKESGDSFRIIKLSLLSKFTFTSDSFS